MLRDTALLLDKQALIDNLNRIKELAGDRTRILINLKANAYGHGAVKLGKFLEDKADRFSVAYANEGLELRRAGIRTPVLVFNPPLYPGKDFFDAKLEPVLYDTAQAGIYIEAAKQQGLKHYPVHIKVDTGMHRSGLMPEKLNDLLKLLAGTDALRPVTVYSHLAAAEDPAEDRFTEAQKALFDRLARQTEDVFPGIIKHLANSAALVRFPDIRYDMVRPGLSVYGYTLVQGDEKNWRPVASLVSKVTQIREIDAGESVGYNRCFKAGKKSRVALIPVGYGDGYFRLFGNGNAYVNIEGERFPVIGNVSMDMITADVSGSKVKPGDKAVLFGKDPDVYELARIARTIPYEIVTAVSRRVPRLWTGERHGF